MRKIANLLESIINWIAQKDLWCTLHYYNTKKNRIACVGCWYIIINGRQKCLLGFLYTNKNIFKSAEYECNKMQKYRCGNHRFGSRIEIE